MNFRHKCFFRPAFFALALLPLAMSGCCVWLALGAGAGAAGVAYHMGQLEVSRSVSLPVAYDASLRALEQLRLDVRTHNCDALVGEISAITADNKEARVSLKKVTDSQTDITVWMLPLPDKERTLSIYEAINKQIDAARRRETP